jgi:hypothetical protein
MEDAARLDDSGEGTLERPMRGGQPLPPPRMDSYRLMRGSGTGSRSGSGSEIYERLPADTGSLGDDLEDRLRISGSEEDVSGHDSDMYILNSQQRPSNGDHLVKPLQIKPGKKPSKQPRQHHRQPQPQGKNSLKCVCILLIIVTCSALSFCMAI